MTKATPMNRRCFLADSFRGFSGLALAAMLHRTGTRLMANGRRPTASRTSRPKAKTVIWLFMNGGVSHMETFDPKPALTKYAGKTITETPVPGRAGPREAQARPRRRHQRRQRPAAQQALPAAGRLQEVRPERHRGQRLVAAHRRVHRRHRRRPLDVDDRRQPRRPDAVPHRPAHARRRVPDARRLGPLRPRHAQRQPAAVHLDGQPRVLEHQGRPLPRPGPRRRSACASIPPTRSTSASRNCRCGPTEQTARLRARPAS